MRSRLLGDLGSFLFERFFTNADDFLQAILETADEGFGFLRLLKAGGAHDDTGV